MRADTQDMRLLREGAVIPDSNILVTGLTLLREDRHHLIGTATMRTFRRTTETVIRVTVDGDRLMWKSDGPFSGIVAIMEDHARWDAEKAERRLRTYLGH